MYLGRAALPDEASAPQGASTRQSLSMDPAHRRKNAAHTVRSLHFGCKKSCTTALSGYKCCWRYEPGSSFLIGGVIDIIDAKKQLKNILSIKDTKPRQISK